MGLRDRGSVDPLAISATDGPLRHDYERQGIPVNVRPELRSGRLVTDDDGALSRLVPIIRDVGLDLVYGNTVQTFFAMDAARHAGCLRCGTSARKRSLGEPSSPISSGGRSRARALDCFTILTA